MLGDSSGLAETAVTASRLALLEAIRKLSSSITELELVLLMIAGARFLFLPPLSGARRMFLIEAQKQMA